MAITLKGRRLAVILCFALGSGFAAGLVGGQVELSRIIEPAFAQSGERLPDLERRTQTMVYAVGSLAIDTEYSAIEIVKLQDRVARLEAAVEDLKAEAGPGD